MNFSVLDFCKFASRMPQIVTDFGLDFQKFPGVGGGGAYPRTYREMPTFFFISNSRL